MRSLTLGIGCLVALACAAPAFAADEAEAGHGDAKAKHEPVVVEIKYLDKDRKEVTRQFDMSSPADANALLAVLTTEHVEEIEKHEKLDIFQIKRWDLGLWSILIFVLLFLALGKFAWKPMLEGLTKREESIRSSLELAEKTRREALAQHEVLQAQMRESAGKGAAMVDDARREAQVLKDRMVAEAKSEIQQERDRLLREVETAKDQALKEIWQSSVSLAAVMSAKAMGRAIGEDDHRRLLDESLADLKDAGAGFSARKLTGAGGI